MTPDDVRVRGKVRHVATADEVARAEALLKAPFPPGYAEYVTTLGWGVLSTFVRVHMPWQVVGGLAEWRDRAAKLFSHYAEGEQKRKLSFAKAKKSIEIADTLGGDTLIYHPAKPDRLYVLPHDDDDVHVLDGSLWDAVDWLCTSGVLTRRLRRFDFEPYPESGRREIALEARPRRKKAGAGAAAPSRSPEETLVAFWDALTALGEEGERRDKEREEGKRRRGEDTHVLTDEDVAEIEALRARDRTLWEASCLMRFEQHVAPSSSEYAPRWRDRIDRVEVRGSKAYVYTRRPDFPSGEMDPHRRKYRWVLQLTDGEWRIKERQEGGMKVDSYRPTSVK